MFGKIKLASGLLAVLAAFCMFQLLTAGLGFWSLTSTHRDVGNLANVALTLEQAAAAASSLHDQTRQLKAAVSVFEISDRVLLHARSMSAPAGAGAGEAGAREPRLAY